MSTPVSKRLPNVLLIGTGEYTTGLVNGQPSNSDKSAGIIALTVFHLRSRGLTGPRVGLCGTSGRKLPMIRKHMQTHIGDRYQLDVICDTYPGDDVDRDPDAYVKALATFERGDVAIVTTPDQTHFAIAAKAIEAGLHTLIGQQHTAPSALPTPPLFASFGAVSLSHSLPSLFLSS